MSRPRAKASQPAGWWVGGRRIARRWNHSRSINNTRRPTIFPGGFMLAFGCVKRERWPFQAGAINLARLWGDLQEHFCIFNSPDRWVALTFNGVASFYYKHFWAPNLHSLWLRKHALWWWFFVSDLFTQKTWTRISLNWECFSSLK